MTPGEFRQAALALAGAVEGAHMGHPDFRVNGRIFATLGLAPKIFANLMLTPEQQAGFIAAYPATFTPVQGGWGAKGATAVRLPVADPAAVEEALNAAWRNQSAKPAKKPKSPPRSASRGSARSR